MKRQVTIALSLCLGLLLLSSCSRRSAPLTSEQKQELQAYVSKDASKPSHPLDIKFGDVITMIGYDVSTDTVLPGREVTVTWHFRVNKQPEKGTLIFTHVSDGKSDGRINLDQQGKLRGFFQPSQWQEGTYVRDTQSFTISEDWGADKVVVYLGFWREDASLDGPEQRLAVVGPSDGRRRAKVLTLPVAEPKIEVPELAVVKAEKPPKLDGKLDEDAWSKAKKTASFVNTMNGESAAPEASVKALYDDKHLYIAFDVADDYLKSSFTNDEDHLWEQDTVEIMADPDGDGKDYIELQVSPANKHFDTHYESRRVPKPFGHVDYDSKMLSAVSLRGKLNDDDPDQGYTVEIAIPWAAFSAGASKTEPPKTGASFRFNFYVMDTQKEGSRAVGWSAPRVGDFHVPARFGKLVFE
jgi:Carbohydrate family 9 binding domain-like